MTCVTRTIRQCKFWITWLWWLKPLLPIYQLYRGGNFYCLRTPEYPEEISDLSKVTDKLYHLKLHRVQLTMSADHRSNFNAVLVNVERHIML